LPYWGFAGGGVASPPLAFLTVPFSPLFFYHHSSVFDSFLLKRIFVLTATFSVEYVWIAPDAFAFVVFGIV
jgi:hypothetical protein